MFIPLEIKRVKEIMENEQEFELKIQLEKKKRNQILNFMTKL